MMGGSCTGTNTSRIWEMETWLAIMNNRRQRNPNEMLMFCSHLMDRNMFA